MRNPKIKFLLGISIFKNQKRLLSQTIQPTELENMTLPSYIAVSAWISNFILYFYNALDVSNPKMELIWWRLVFFIYNSQEASGQTIWPIKIKTVGLFFILSWPYSLQSFFCSYYSALIQKLSCSIVSIWSRWR